MNSKICAKFPFSILLNAFLVLLAINVISAAPVTPKESIFTKFVKEMLASSCVMPDQIVFPFKLASNVTGNVDSPLTICENTPVERSKEAIALCEEIFGIWKSISCRNASNFSNLPKINVTLANNVCKDLSDMKSVIPEEEILMKSMTNAIVCDIMCDAVFEKTCQVLLWSYKVQSRIKEVQKAQSENQETDNAQDQPEELSKENDIDAESLPSKPKASEPVQSLKKAAESETSPTESEKNTAVKTEAEIIKTEEQTPIQTGSEDDAHSVTEKSTSEDTNTDKANLESENHKVANPDVIVETNGDAGADEKPEEDFQSKTGSSDSTKLSLSSITPDEKSIPQSPTIKDNEIQSKIHTDSIPDKGSNKSPSDSKTTAEMDKTETEETSENIKKENIVPQSKTASVDEPSGGKEPEDKDKASIVHTSSFQSTDVSPEVSSLASSSDQTFATLEKMEGDSDPPQMPNKVPDQYADLENTEADADDGEDYPRPNYDGKIDESAKTQHQVPITSGSSSVKVYVPNDPNEKSFNEFPSIEKFGHGSEEMRVLASFPDQEDSHFFFYFLSMVLILMSGYLIFHNKQKIIALIVEGRHERRRRSNGAGYKKLDTK